MAYRQQVYLAFVLSVVLMCFVAEITGRRSCPAGRPAVDICSQGTVHTSETLLVDFSPEAGITSCNCNLTIDGFQVNVSSLVAPQNQCRPQLEVELGVDYLEVDCSDVSKSYDTAEVQNGNIWTMADVFYSSTPPQDLCLELNVEGGASTVSITCYVERDWDPSTTEAVTMSLESVTLSPEGLPLTTEATVPPTPTGPVTVITTTSQIATTDIPVKDIPGPPGSIRDAILKLAKNDESPVLFENSSVPYNGTETALSDATAIETPVSERILPDVITSGKTFGGPLLPPKDIMDKILDVANATTNPIRIEHPSTSPLQNVTDLPTATTSLQQPTETVMTVPVVPPTDVMNQLLDIANNVTNDTIVFPEVPSAYTADNATSSAQAAEQTTVVGSRSTIPSVETSTQQTTDAGINTTVLPETTSTTHQETTGFDVNTTVLPETTSTTQQQTTDLGVSTTVLPDTTPTIQQQTTDLGVSTTVLPDTTSTTQQQTTDLGVSTTVLPDTTSTTPQQTTGVIKTTSTLQTVTKTTQKATVVVETTPKQPMETVTTLTMYPSTGYHHTPYDELPLDSNVGDWSSHPDSSTMTNAKATTIRKASRGDIEIPTQTDKQEMTSLPETATKPVSTVTTQINDPTITTTVPVTDDVTGARNGTSPDDKHGSEDTLIVIVVGTIIGIIVIVAIIAIIRAFCKSRRKSANITMMEKGGMENGSGATMGIDNPLVQLQQEQEMVETNPNPINVTSGTDENNDKMEANFSEGATEMNGNGVSNVPPAGDEDVFQSAVNH